MRLAGASAVSVWDVSETATAQSTAARLRATGVEVSLGPGSRPSLEHVGCVVKSPGIPLQSPLLEGARRAGVTVIDELELGWRLSKRRLVGVTGTNGKTTTTGMIAAAMGGVDQGGNTEFHPPLSALNRSGDPVACEVSSFQLEGSPELMGDVAVLTNLTRDHLHRHQTMEAYGEAKRLLFARKSRVAALAVVGVDQPFGMTLASQLEAAGAEIARVGCSTAADYRLEDSRAQRHGWSLRARTPGGVLEIAGLAPGRHNALNALTAFAAARLIGVEGPTATAAIAATPPVPGRFEGIREGQPFRVVVDFAHNPDAVRAALTAARAEAGGGRLLVVMSTAGTNDPGKRPAMGAAGRALSDRLIFTRDALFDEPIQSIWNGLLSGAASVGGDAPELDPDRRSAIASALSAARPGDFVAILGRGAIPHFSDDPDGRDPPFDDRVVTRELLGELGYSAGANADS